MKGVDLLQSSIIHKHLIRHSPDDIQLRENHSTIPTLWVGGAGGHDGRGERPLCSPISLGRSGMEKSLNQKHSAPRVPTRGLIRP